MNFDENESEMLSYSKQLVKTLREHRLINPIEEEAVSSYLFAVQ